jgi:hypothetical protein
MKICIGLSQLSEQFSISRQHGMPCNQSEIDEPNFSRQEEQYKVYNVKNHFMDEQS